MLQPASESQGRKKRVLVAGIGAAIVTAGITAVLMSGNPAPSIAPA
jgi:hypothetical protein